MSKKIIQQIHNFFLGGTKRQKSEHDVQPPKEVNTTVYKDELIHALREELRRDFWQIGCEANHDGDSLLVKYQGEIFDIRIKSGNRFTIIDWNMYATPLENNMDNVSMVMKAVNHSNSYDIPVLFYIIEHEHNVMSVHSHYECISYDIHTDRPTYLRNLLNHMFDAHRVFFHVMEDKRQEEYARNMR